MLALLVVLAVQAPEAARAESLLAAGALPEARAIAERLVARFPREPRYHLLLGRIWFAWPVIGRYDALAAYRTAARLAPHDPEPLYGQVEVGFYLGSDEGEVMAREALLRLFALDPDYRDSWARFMQLFRNDAVARRADRALAQHPGHRRALERRAELAIALGEPARAESLAALLLEHPGSPVAALLLRAEAAFLQGRDSAGQVWHDWAVEYAHLDSTEMLWDRAWTIASPDEAARYAAAAPAARRPYFQRFWAMRDPNLLTTFNERLGEHVRRLAEARYQFRLLHPFRQVYRSRTARVLEWFEQRRWLEAYAALAPLSVDRGLSDRNAAIPRVGQLDFRALQDLAHTRAYRAGLDARGLTYVRHGPPDVRVPCALDPRFPADAPGCVSFLDVEGWLYETPAGLVSVGFVRAEYFQPASPDQMLDTEWLMRTDASSVPAPAEVRAWTAFFRGADGDATDAYARAAADSAALVLWSADGEERGRVSGRGLLGLAVRPGTYHVGIDVDSAGVLGRLRSVLRVPEFTPGSLALSSLILAADSPSGDRTATLAAMPPDLGYATGAPLGAYTEIYGLGAVDGAVRYRARYTFEPARSFFGRLVRGTAPVSFEFERRAAGGETVVERLLLEPGRVPAGRYRVTLAVTDLATNVKSETVTLVVTLR